MRIDIDGMSFQASIEGAVITVNTDEFTTEERTHRYKLGDVRCVFGQMYIACCCLRSDRWVWFRNMPDDIITWRKCDLETAMDASQWSERARYSCYY